MGKLLLVVHQEHSATGRVGEKLAAMGHEIDLRRPCMGHDLPATLDEHDGVVVFGGPMSANDEHLPFIRAELDWLPKVVDSGKPFLGICLGAQLLARTGGGTVRPHHEGWHEIGYYPIKPTTAGQHLFDAPMDVFHWHGEGIDLPKSATLLAVGEKFPTQAFKLGANAYGIQFHPEVTLEQMRLWATRGAHRLVLPGAQPRETMEEGWKRHDPGLARWLDRFLAHWLPARTPEIA